MTVEKYAIAMLGQPSPDKYSFLSQLQHEFAGAKEALGYSTLDNALKWDTEEKAIQHLNELPEWAKGKHQVIKVENYGLGWRYYDGYREHFKKLFDEEGEK